MCECARGRESVGERVSECLRERLREYVTDIGEYPLLHAIRVDGDAVPEHFCTIQCERKVYIYRHNHNHNITNVTQAYTNLE